MPSWSSRGSWAPTLAKNTGPDDGEGRVGVGTLLTEASDETRCDANGVGDGVPGDAVSHGLAFDPVLLVVEGEGDEIGRVEDGIGSGGGVVAPRADKEGDVADTEGC